MHRLSFAVISLWTSLAWAIEPGYMAYQAAEQKLSEVVTVEKSLPPDLTAEQRKKQIFEKKTELQNQAYEQCKISISHYQAAFSESIDVSAVYFCLVNSIENCEGPSAKSNCGFPIQSVLQIAQKQLAGKPEAIGLQNLIGGFYERQKRFADAMFAYYPAYTHFAKTPCSRDHVNQLVTILNLQLESGDQNGFNQYWKISSYCETSGLIQPRGTKIVRDTSANRVTLAAAPSIDPATMTATVAPVVPRQLPPKVQPKPERAVAKVETKAKKETEESDEAESEEEDIIASSEVVTKSPSPEKQTAQPAKAAATKLPVTSAQVAGLAIPAADKSAPETAKDSEAKPAAAEDTTVREPAVATEIYKSIQDFVPGLLKAIAKNNPAWEASLTQRRSKKNKTEEEARELEEIFKIKKESEKKAMDQMMSNDPDMRAKQLKNLLRFRLGDPVDKIKATLGKPTLEDTDQHSLTYDQLNTGATVGELVEGKMPPFIGLVFKFTPAGHLQEIKYSYPQGHGNIVCK